MTLELDEAVARMENSVDAFSWYWLSYGEKCYAFAVIAAIAADPDDAVREPRPGSMLWRDEHDRLIGENGVEMMDYQTIAMIERQEGEAICQFIAEAHAALVASRRK